MNIRALLMILIGVGILMFGVGVYLSLKPDVQPVQISQSNSQLNNKTITVPSNVMWYDTGIDIPNGKTLIVEYRSGHWTNVRGTNFVDGVGKQFDRRHLLIVPESYLASLVGKVGANSFHIGNSYRGNPGSGRLYLSINDIPKTYNDNDGSLDINIAVK